MAIAKWSDQSALTEYLTTTLNSLANNTTDLGVTVIDNQTNKNIYIDLELILASLDLSTQSNPAVEIYDIESIDGGTDYDTATAATATAALYPSADKLLCTIGLRLGSGAEIKVATKTGLVITPGKHKLLLINKTGVAFAAADNILSYRTYNTEIA